jgi:hypothetical protein
VSWYSGGFLQAEKGALYTQLGSEIHLYSPIFGSLTVRSGSQILEICSVGATDISPMRKRRVRYGDISAHTVGVPRHLLRRLFRRSCRAGILQSNYVPTLSHRANVRRACSTFDPTNRNKAGHICDQDGIRRQHQPPPGHRPS